MGTYFTPPAAVVDGTTAKAADVNNLSDATDAGFDNVETAIGGAETAAAASAASAAEAAADVVLTNADVVSTGVDVGLTNADVVLTHADVVLTNADVVLTGIDVGLTNADVVSTNADVVSTNADVATIEAASGTNALVNSNFTINQYVYVSDAVLASGSFGHNRWRAGAGGGDYTFTQLTTDTTITIKAGKTLIQAIAPEDIHSTTYTLSWEGTAQGRYAVDSDTPAGAYAASPIAITGQTVGTIMSIEFDDGTLGRVMLAEGSTEKDYHRKSRAETEDECSRFMNIVTVAARSEGPAGAISSNSVNWPRMRNTPTQTTIVVGSSANITASALTVDYLTGGYFTITGDLAGDAYHIGIRIQLESEI